MHQRPIFLALLAMLFCAGSLHAARWVKDLVYLHSEATGRVPFSHYAHLEVLGRDCTECHNRIFHIDPEKNPPVTMAEMEQGLPQRGTDLQCERELPVLPSNRPGRFRGPGRRRCYLQPRRPSSQLRLQRLSSRPLCSGSRQPAGVHVRHGRGRILRCMP